MKKRVLNLSLLMLLSTSFNAFGIDENSSVLTQFLNKLKPTTATYQTSGTATGLETLPDNAVQEASKTLQSVIETVKKSPNAEGVLQTAVNRAIDAIKNVDLVSENARFSGLRQFINNSVTLGNLLKGALRSAYDTALENTQNLKDLIVANPKTASLAVAATLGTAGLYKLLQSRKMVAPSDDQTRGVAIIETETTKINPELKAQIDAEIEAQGGDINFSLNNGRSLLMKYSEGHNANLDAVKYLISQGANLNQEDLSTNELGRTALAYAAYWGKKPLVEYFLSLNPDNKATALQYAQISKANKAKNYEDVLQDLESINDFDEIIALLQ